jgi:hypothetical protein
MFFGVGHRVVYLAYSLAQAGMIGVEESLDGLSHMFVEMPAIGDLNVRRSALPSAVSICAGSVPADQFNRGRFASIAPAKLNREFPLQ